MRQFEHTSTNRSIATAEPPRQDRGNGRPARLPQEPGADQPDGHGTPRRNSDYSRLFRQLAEPFPESALGWKAQATSGERALAVAFIDARTVMDRLDSVLGPENWRDSYEVDASGSVVCGLSLRLGSEWIAKYDVGSRSDQSDDGDQLKAAFSDSLKRAAVRWGIGRYLYSLPKQWVGYDPQRKQLTETPRLPAWAIPSGSASNTPAPATTERVENTPPRDRNGNGQSHSNGDPRTGRELFRWLRDQEQALVDEQLAMPGELIEHIAHTGEESGFGSRIVQWGPEAVARGKVEAMAFIAHRQGDSAE